MTEPDYGRSPRICVDRLGRWWVAWISCGKQGECVKTCFHRRDGSWSTVQKSTQISARVTAIALSPWKDRVLLAWIDGGDPHKNGLKMRWVAPENAGDVLLISPLARAPAHVELSATESGFALAFSERGVLSRTISVFLGNDPDAPCRSFVVFDDDGSIVRPAISMQKGDVAVVRQALSKGLSKIELCQIKNMRDISDTVLLSARKDSQLAMPAICPSRDPGYFVAWQSNADSSGGPRLVRWIEIVHFDRDGTISEMAEPMPGVKRRERGEDQGFEFPSLVCFEDGSLVVVGRGSQSINRQDVGQGGWSERIQVDDPGWGCRGSRVSTCAVGDSLLVAVRERAGIAVRRLSKGANPTVGKPRLATGREIITNPSKPSAITSQKHSIAGRRILFGDLHQHTIASDGTGTIEESLLRCRDLYGDDIAAISDHESFLGKTTSEGEWAETRRIVDELYSPGEFVTLHAFEWTGSMHPGPGHKVVYLPEDGGPILSRESDEAKSSRRLLEASRKVGALVVPHHVGWTGADLENHIPELQPCFEIVSCHGAYERPGFETIGTRGDDKQGQFVGDALDKGLRFGFMGGSDGHGLNWHHGVCRKEDSHRTGLTAVFAEDVNRSEVLDAILKRHCYATSGAKIGLWFEIDGHPMGEEISIDTQVPYRIIVSATCDIDSLALVTNGGQEETLDVTGKKADLSGAIAPPRAGDSAYYYVRVVQRDKEVAWSSPIWIDSTTFRPAGSGAGQR